MFGGITTLADTTIQARRNANCSIAKIPQIRIYDFRHNCASLLISSGAIITLVAKHLGHARIDMTLNSYSHMYKSQLDEIVNIINNL